MSCTAKRPGRLDWVSSLMGSESSIKQDRLAVGISDRDALRAGKEERGGDQERIHVRESDRSGLFPDSHGCAPLKATSSNGDLCPSSS